MKGYMSASGIKRFHGCPKSWWFHYVSDQEPVDGDTTYLDLGNAVHDALEDGLNGFLKNDRNLQSFAMMRYAHYANVYDVDDLYETGRDCVDRAVSYIEKQDPDILGVEAEKEFDVDRPDLNETFKAKLDVTTDTEIWDWKTGSIRDGTAHDERVQGAVYMAAYRVMYGHAPEKIRFVYLKEEKVRSLDPDDDVWDTMLAAARSLAAAKREGEFPARPGDACYWCDYEQFCAEAGGIGEGFDWEGWMA